MSSPRLLRSKTSLFNALCSRHNPDAVIPEPLMPTIGQNFGSIRLGRLEMELLDLGGQKQFRQSWVHYLDGLDGMFFVVDSVERELFSEIQAVLRELVSSHHLAGAPICVVANKQDDAGAMPLADLARILDLDAIMGERRYTLASASVGAGARKHGALEALEWMRSALSSDPSRENALKRSKRQMQRWRGPRT